MIDLNIKKSHNKVRKSAKTKRIQSLKSQATYLNQSKTKLDDIFRNHDAVMILIDPSTDAIIDINQSALKFYGYNRMEFKKLTLADLNAPMTEAETNLVHTQQKKKSALVLPHLLSSGEVRYVEMHISRIKSGKNNFEFAIIHDITDRYLTEKKLQFRHDFEMLIASISTFFIRPDHYEIDAAVNKALQSIGEFMQVDQSFIIQFSEDLSTIHLTHNWSTEVFNQKRTLLNAQSEKFPYAAHKLFKGDVFFAEDKSDLPKEAKPERELMQQNGIKSFIIVPTVSAGMVIGGIGFTCVKEKKIWPEDAITLLRVIGEIITNALKRRETEKALRDSENKYRKFVEEDISGDFIISPKGKIIFCNTAFVRIFGFSSVKKALQSNIEAVATPHLSLLKELSKIKKDTMIEGEELQLKRTDGEPVYVIANLRGVYDENDSLIEYKGYLFDITSHKRIEEQLRGAQKMEAIGRLAGGIAHDFNNILTVINGYSELLLNSGYIPNSERSRLEQIKRAGERASSLTGQLLAFSRKQIVKPKILNLNDVVNEVDNMLSRLIGENIAICTILERNIRLIKIDPTQLEQVILNLAINARDAMPMGGKLTFRTENIVFKKDQRLRDVVITKGSYVKFSVTDTGIGMDSEIQSHIFEPFFTTKDRGKGTGLGLSTIYGIVKQSDSYITVDSVVNKGTCFTIYFPCQDSPVDESMIVKKRNLSLSGSEKIIVVEDDEMVRELTVSFLENYNYSVAQASNADEAIRKCHNKDKEFDLAIIDVVMPGMGGKDLADIILQKQPQIKILYISGYTDDAIVQHGILNSSVEFLQKPFSADQLAAKVRKIFDNNS